MMDYCLENDEEIAITSIGRDQNIEKTFGWGKIIRRESYPDGRSNIIIHGMGVGRLIKFKSQEPFFIALTEKVENDFTHLNKVEYRQVLLEILRLTKLHLEYMEAEETFIDELEKLKTHPFPIDVIASFLDLDFNRKQEILVCLDPYDKALLLLRFLNNLIKEQNS